jgi:hypothetical protein
MQETTWCTACCNGPRSFPLSYQITFRLLSQIRFQFCVDTEEARGYASLYAVSVSRKASLERQAKAAGRSSRFKSPGPPLRSFPKKCRFCPPLISLSFTAKDGLVLREARPMKSGGDAPSRPWFLLSPNHPFASGEHDRVSEDQHH